MSFLSKEILVTPFCSGFGWNTFLQPPSSFPLLPVTICFKLANGVEGAPWPDQGTDIPPVLGIKGGLPSFTRAFWAPASFCRRALSRSPRVHVSHFPTLTIRARVILILPQRDQYWPLVGSWRHRQPLGNLQTSRRFWWIEHQKPNSFVLTTPKHQDSIFRIYALLYVRNPSVWDWDI